MAAVLAVNVLACLVLRAHAAFAPNVAFNFTLLPHDPVLYYTPDAVLGTAGVPPFAPLWNLTFDDTPWTSYRPGQLGLGSSHMSATNNDSNPQNYMYPGVVLREAAFSDIYLAGAVAAIPGSSQKVVVVDNSTVIPFDDLTSNNAGWIARTTVPYGEHALAFAISGAWWRIDSVVATMALQTLASSWDDVQFTKTPFAVLRQGIYSLTDAFAFSGQWKVATTIGGVAGDTSQQPQTYYHVTGELGSSISVTVPANTSMFVLKGLVQPQGSLLGLDWNPDPPLTNAKIVRTEGLFVADSTLVVTTLDPAVNYTLTLTPGDKNTTVGLSEAIFYSSLKAGASPSGSPKKKSNAAAIGGGVGGGVGGLLLLGLVAFCCWKKRKPKKAENDESKFEIDQEGVPVEPYVDQKLAAASNPNGSYQTTNAVGYTDGAITTPATSEQGPSSHPYKQQLLSSMATSSASAAGSSSSGAQPQSMPAQSIPSQPQMTDVKHVYTAPAPTRRPAFAQEEDAGAVPTAQVTEPDRIPPSYNPEWRSSTDATAEAGPSAGPSHSGVAWHSPLSQDGRPLPRTPDIH